ncbi:hypothetical protein AB4525_08850 [Vibrio breoganii]
MSIHAIKLMAILWLVFNYLFELFLDLSVELMPIFFTHLVCIRNLNLDMLLIVTKS